jgi:hypothetical protein
LELSAFFADSFQVYSSVSQPNERVDIIMTNEYRRSVLAPKERVQFDPRNRKHMIDFARFVKYNSWRDGCSYFLEDPYTDIPSMIRAKIADYTLSKLVEKV